MAGAVVDTDILIDVLRGHEPTILRLARLRGRSELATTTITAFELLRGEMTPRRVANISLLLEELELLSLDVASAAEAAAIDRTLGARGLRLATGDTLIAGIALANRLPLMTNNLRHFRRVESLELLDPA